MHYTDETPVMVNNDDGTVICGPLAYAVGILGLEKAFLRAAMFGDTYYSAETGKAYELTTTEGVREYPRSRKIMTPNSGDQMVFTDKGGPDITGIAWLDPLTGKLTAISGATAKNPHDWTAKEEQPLVSIGHKIKQQEEVNRQAEREAKQNSAYKHTGMFYTMVTHQDEQVKLTLPGDHLAGVYQRIDTAKAAKRREHVYNSVWSATMEEAWRMLDRMAMGATSERMKKAVMDDPRWIAKGGRA